MQVLGLGIAVVNADDTSTRAALDMSPMTTCATDYRDEVRASADAALDDARLDATVDLKIKLDKPEPAEVKLAGNPEDKRG